MNNEVKVNIIEDNEKAFMVFEFDEPIKIEITSDDLENTKKMFYKILEKVINEENIKFIFNKEKEDLYSETTEKYINHLNSEIEVLKTNFDNPIDNEYSS